MTAQIVADVLLKTDKVTRGVSQVSGKLRGLASSTGSTFKGMLGANLVAGAVGKVGDALGTIPDKVRSVRDAGSALQQSSGAVEAVFGKHTKGITRAAEAAGGSLGLSKNAYQELASVVGAGLKNKGIKDYAGETKRLLGLGGDLAAQFGGSTKDSVEAISSLMRGETDPIERYGVSINESAVSAELAAKGQDKLKGAALEQAKAQARVALLFKQTKDAQGAFSRESDTYAGVAARNAAAMENLKGKLGTALLPAFTAGANLISTKVIPVLDKVVTWASSALPGALSAARTALAPVFASIQGFASQVGPLLAKAFSGGGLQTFLQQAQPLGQALLSVFAGVRAVVVALLPIVAQVVGAIISGVRSVLPELTSAYQAVASILQSVASILASVWKAIGPIVLPIITSVFGTVISVISGALKIIAGLFKVISSVLQGDWRGAWDGIKQVVSGAWSIIKAVVSNAANVMRVVITTVLNGIKGSWSAWSSAVQSIVRGAWSRIRSLVSAGLSAVSAVVRTGINTVKSVMSAGWTAVSSTAVRLWNTIRSSVSTGVSRVVALVKAVPGKLRDALAGSLEGAGSRLIGTLVAGVRSRISDAVQAVSDGLAKIRGLLPGSPIKDGPLKSWNNGGAGKRLMALLAGGIRAESSNVQGAMEAALQPPRVNLTTALRSASAANRAATGGASAAPTTINVRLDVPVGASGVDIGRELVTYLRQYSSATGQRIVVG